MPLKIKVMAVVIFMDTHAGETLFKMLISNIQPVITIMPARITISDNTLAIFLFRDHFFIDYSKFIAEDYQGVTIPQESRLQGCRSSCRNGRLPPASPS
jgi:hypothetical protein